MSENVVKHGEFVYILLIYRLALYEIYLLLLSPDTGKEWNLLIIIIMYIYHALSAHMIHINLHMIFYTHVEHSPTKTIYIK